MEPGVATVLEWRGVGSRKRPYAPHENRMENVWVDQREWWPLTAAAMALYILRTRHGVRALVTHPPKETHLS